MFMCSRTIQIFARVPRRDRHAAGCQNTRAKPVGGVPQHLLSLAVNPSS